MKNALELFKWIIGTLVRRTFVFLFALALTALGIVCWGIYKLALAYNVKCEEVVKQQDRTIKAQSMLIDLQNKSIEKSNQNGQDHSR